MLVTSPIIAVEFCGAVDGFARHGFAACGDLNKRAHDGGSAIERALGAAQCDLVAAHRHVDVGHDLLDDVECLIVRAENGDGTQVVGDCDVAFEDFGGLLHG